MQPATGVGLADGEAEGELLGFADGDELGFADGDALGLGDVDGIEDGFADGDALGIGVTVGAGAGFALPVPLHAESPNAPAITAAQAPFDNVKLTTVSSLSLIGNRAARAEAALTS